MYRVDSICGGNHFEGQTRTFHFRVSSRPMKRKTTSPGERTTVGRVSPAWCNQCVYTLCIQSKLNHPYNYCTGTSIFTFRDVHQSSTIYRFHHNIPTIFQHEERHCIWRRSETKYQQNFSKPWWPLSLSLWNPGTALPWSTSTCQEMAKWTGLEEEISDVGLW